LSAPKPNSPAMRGLVLDSWTPTSRLSARRQMESESRRDLWENGMNYSHTALLDRLSSKAMSPIQTLADRLAPPTGRALPRLDGMTQRMNPTSCRPLSNRILPRDTLTCHVVEELRSAHSPPTVETNLPRHPRPLAVTVRV
jgi:hypothetical protein